jgi:hypothetical protein
MATPEYLTDLEKETIDKNEAVFRTIILETPLDSTREGPPCEYCEKPTVKALISHSMYAPDDDRDKVRLIVGIENMPGYRCENDQCPYLLKSESEGDPRSALFYLSDEGILEMEQKMVQICLELGLNKAAGGFAESARVQQELLLNPS